MDRRETLMSMFNPAGRGLEIGPGFNPLIPKASGLPIETVDHATATELREKWKDDPRVDVSKIEEVDYISHGASIAEAVGKRGHYDYVFASHVIEHATDLLGFLKDCQALLKPNGILVLAIPDKRRCFDVFRPRSSTGAVLQAHLEGRTRHTPGEVFDYYAHYALRDGEIAWAAGHDGELSFEYDLPRAQEAYNQARISEAYQDVHAWCFTGSSFRMVVSDLNALGELDLREQAFGEAPGIEFYISLSRQAAGCPYDRLTLAKLGIVEQYEVLADPPALVAHAPESTEERLRRLEAICGHLAGAG